MEQVILVDEQDNVVGAMDKLDAHRQGVLHRAFSIVIFNSKGELLLQKRSVNKYHSGGLWTNSCCSHPKPDELISHAASSRLNYEMGIDLQPAFAYKFLYKSQLNNNLIEHELDHVFTGVFDGTPVINSDEVEDWKFVNIDNLRADILQNPDDYTVWFRLIMEHPNLKQITA
jgi:isopentenyl-diphosphate delta-isomerase